MDLLIEETQSETMSIMNKSRCKNVKKREVIRIFFPPFGLVVYGDLILDN